MKLVKHSPAVLAGLFLLITVSRVASFVDTGLFGYLFAVGLALGVFVSSYLASYQKARTSGLVVMCFFIFVDGVFNLTEVLHWSVEGGRWARTIDLFGWELFFFRMPDLLYGLFPTVALAVLGWLGRDAKAIPLGRPGQPRGIVAWLQRELSGWMDDLLGVPQEGTLVSADPEPKPKPKKKPQPSSVSLYPKVAAYLQRQDQNELPSARKIAAELGIGATAANTHKRTYIEQRNGQEVSA